MKLLNHEIFPPTRDEREYISMRFQLQPSVVINVGIDCLPNNSYVAKGYIFVKKREYSLGAIYHKQKRPSVTDIKKNLATYLSQPAYSRILLENEIYNLPKKVNGKHYSTMSLETLRAKASRGDAKASYMLEKAKQESRARDSKNRFASVRLFGARLSKLGVRMDMERQGVNYAAAEKMIANTYFTAVKEIRAMGYAAQNHNVANMILFLNDRNRDISKLNGKKSYVDEISELNALTMSNLGLGGKTFPTRAAVAKAIQSIRGYGITADIAAKLANSKLYDFAAAKVEYKTTPTAQRVAYIIFDIAMRRGYLKMGIV